jgi:hypothetical protein
MRCLGERFGKIMPGKTLVSADDRLTRRLAGSGLCRGLLGMQAVAGSIALLMLLWVGAISPHLVHHLADADHGQICLLSVQASHVPSLLEAGPSPMLAQVAQAWPPDPAADCLWVHIAVTGLPRAPPTARS